MKSVSYCPAKSIGVFGAILIFAHAHCDAWTDIPGKAYEGWPKLVSDPSGPKTTYRNFRILVSEADDQTAAGTGGSVSDIKVTNTTSGKTLQIETQCIDIKVLKKYHGFPQIEVWSRGGGGTFSRALYRVEKGEYHSIRDDLFDVRVENAKRKDVTAVVPGGSDILYYTGTMYPTPETGE